MLAGFIVALATLSGAASGLGCGARTGADNERASADSGIDSGRSDAGGTVIDAGAPPDAGPGPVTCVGHDDVGGFIGSVPIGAIDFPFVAAGVESPTTHSCPRLFIRAGADAAFVGDFLEIEVPYGTAESIGPGLRPGFMNVFIDGEVWSEEVMVDVTRADGLFADSTMLPVHLWRASAELHHHDATTDLDSVIVDASYCTDFPLCL
jgi:hypothetical protein